MKLDWENPRPFWNSCTRERSWERSSELSTPKDFRSSSSKVHMLLMWYRPVARNRWAYCSFETERSHISTSVTDPSSGRRAGGCTKGCDTLLEPHPPWMLWMWFPEALTGKTSDRLKWSASLSSGLPPERLPGSKEKDSDSKKDRPETVDGHDRLPAGELFPPEPPPIGTMGNACCMENMKLGSENFLPEWNP